MSEAKTFTGGCHCGAVRFEVTTDLAKTITCNCSYCAKMGWILTFAPESSFTLVSGEEQLTEYMFNKKVIHHTFCKVCGVHPFGRSKNQQGEPTVAINVRCLDDVDTASLTPFAWDGKSA